MIEYHRNREELGLFQFNLCQTFDFDASEGVSKSAIVDSIILAMSYSPLVPFIIHETTRGYHLIVIAPFSHISNTSWHQLKSNPSFDPWYYKLAYLDYYPKVLRTKRKPEESPYLPFIKNTIFCLKGLKSGPYLGEYLNYVEEVSKNFIDIIPF